MPSRPPPHVHVRRHRRRQTEWWLASQLTAPFPSPLAPWLTPGRDVRRHRSWAPRAWGGGVSSRLGSARSIWTPAPGIVSSSLPLCLPPSLLSKYSRASSSRPRYYCGNAFRRMPTSGRES
ncbi:unnamed protein product [Musa textilis]